MTDDDLETRLRLLLSTRADEVNPDLDGPTLRARGSETSRHWVAALAVAAAVVVIVLVTQALASHPGHAPHRQQPGVSVSVPLVPSSPSPSARTSVSVPVLSTAPTVSVAPVVPVVPSLSSLAPTASPGTPELPVSSTPTSAPDAPPSATMPSASHG